MDYAEIKGGAYLNPATVAGAVRTPGAAVGGQLSLRGAILSNEGGDALYIESARFFYLDLTPAAVNGLITLDAAQITVLSTPHDRNDMEVLIGSELLASGWRLGDVQGRIRHDKKSASDWLGGEGEEFVAQPWHELANLYDRNGQPADARWMRLKAARGVTRTSPWWSKPIRWIYDALTGHGYYPLRAAGWLILAIVTSGLIVAANPAVFTPHRHQQGGLENAPTCRRARTADHRGHAVC